MKPDTVILDTAAKIRHLNIRKEGPQDDKALAIDIKISDARASPALLARLLGADCVEAVLESFWDGEGNPKYLGLEPVESWAVLQHAKVSIESITFDDATLRKFSARICSNQKIEVSCAISVSNPSADYAAILAEYIADDVSITVTMPQGELNLDA